MPKRLAENTIYANWQRVCWYLINNEQAVKKHLLYSMTGQIVEAQIMIYPS